MSCRVCLTGAGGCLECRKVMPGSCWQMVLLLVTSWQWRPRVNQGRGMGGIRQVVAYDALVSECLLEQFHELY